MGMRNIGIQKPDYSGAVNASQNTPPDYSTVANSQGKMNSVPPPQANYQHYLPPRGIMGGGAGAPDYGDVARQNQSNPFGGGGIISGTPPPEFNPMAQVQSAQPIAPQAIGRRLRYGMNYA